MFTLMSIVYFAVKFTPVVQCALFMFGTKLMSPNSLSLSLSLVILFGSRCILDTIASMSVCVCM